MRRLWAVLRDQRGQFDIGGFEGIGLPDTGGGGGFSWGDLAGWLQGAGGGFGNFARSLLPLMNLGLGGLQLYSGISGAGQLARQTKLAERAGRTQERLAGEAERAAAPIMQFSADELARASRGEIPTAMQADIDRWSQAAKARVMDYAARAGLGDSSALQSMLQQVEQQAESMRAAILQQMMQLAVSAGGTAGGILGGAGSLAGGAGQLAAGQQGTLEQLIAQANQMLGRMTAGAV